MARVDFYVLSAQGVEETARTACRVAEKAYMRGHRVYIHTSSSQHAATVDDLLWTFRAGSFVPHATTSEPGVTDRTPVLIGTEPAPETHSEVLINLDREVPDFFARFQRIAEFVEADEEARQRARERFRYYRDYGCDVQTHELS